MLGDLVLGRALLAAVFGAVFTAAGSIFMLLEQTLPRRSLRLAIAGAILISLLCWSASAYLYTRATLLEPRRPW